MGCQPLALERLESPPALEGECSFASIEEVAAEFATRVQPALRADCSACHSVEAGRQFTVDDDGVETFFRARAGAFFADAPGSLLARVSSAEAAVVMPRGAAPWSTERLQALARIACGVHALDSPVVSALDEQFPRQLLEPFEGEVRGGYENSFINFVQLKGKVKAIFGQSWAQGFEKHIGFFGGANFTTTFAEARAATAEFLMGLDVLGAEVCGGAAAHQTGPFVGLELNRPLFDVPAAQTQTFEQPVVTCIEQCQFVAQVEVPAPGQYQLVVRARAMGSVEVSLGLVGASLHCATPDAQTATLEVTLAGPTSLGVTGALGLELEQVQLIGPLGEGTGTSHVDAIGRDIDTLYQRMLFRSASAHDSSQALTLLRDLASMGTRIESWSGLCEALVHHPDFLFALPPSQGPSAALVSLTQSLLGRPPNSSEFELLARGGFEPVVDAVLASPDFESYYFTRMQLRLETQGTQVSDEPARLSTWVAVNGRPFSEIITADYTVDSLQRRQARDAVHGRTGVLTMKGYLSSKPGLPHYNYPARVMSGFMGTIFEVAPEVLEQRGAATAISTVDPKSVCFSCHQWLTPLAHQRQKWSDDGSYRERNADGSRIDDSDQGLVEQYPYKGTGLEAFSLKAVVKEAFIRRMINAHFKLLMGRDLRHADDERGLYQTLWNTAVTEHGNLKAILKAVALSEAFARRNTR